MSVRETGREQGRERGGGGGRAHHFYQVLRQTIRPAPHATTASHTRSSRDRKLKIVPTARVVYPDFGVAMRQTLQRLSKSVREGSSHRIISYNILSTLYADPFYYKHCFSEYLETNYRFHLLQIKLNKEIEQNSIICLQEVCTSIWYPDLL
jgi:hypothetical protein